RSFQTPQPAAKQEDEPKEKDATGSATPLAHLQQQKQPAAVTPPPQQMQQQPAPAAAAKPTQLDAYVDEVECEPDGSVVQQREAPKVEPLSCVSAKKADQLQQQQQAQQAAVQEAAAAAAAQQTQPEKPVDAPKPEQPEH
ncbi:hypothetical protein PMAYCL1PPCAC_01676, partial [Pristionchus mayeri]